jgi:hypothetical protein
MTKIKPQQLQAQKAAVPAIKYDNVWLEDLGKFSNSTRATG